MWRNNKLQSYVDPPNLSTSLWNGHPGSQPGTSHGGPLVAAGINCRKIGLGVQVCCVGACMFTRECCCVCTRVCVCMIGCIV